MNSLGAFLERQRAHAPAWRKALFAALALLVVANLFVNTHEPHFVIDAYPGFWAGFGLVVGLIPSYEGLSVPPVAPPRPSWPDPSRGCRASAT